jgi:pimeloyl-ACP methyl ester carboxylesterase
MPTVHFAVVNGVKPHCRLVGSGEPAMILLHGFAAGTLSWREVMVPLAKLGTVVAPERPPSGLTERPLSGDRTAESPYGPDAKVDHPSRATARGLQSRRHLA